MDSFAFYIAGAAFFGLVALFVVMAYQPSFIGGDELNTNLAFAMAAVYWPIGVPALIVAGLGVAVRKGRERRLAEVAARKAEIEEAERFARDLAKREAR